MDENDTNETFKSLGQIALRVVETLRPAKITSVIDDENRTMHFEPALDVPARVESFDKAIDAGNRFDADSSSHLTERRSAAPHGRVALDVIEQLPLLRSEVQHHRAPGETRGRSRCIA
jgi:hypothetical protein